MINKAPILCLCLVVLAGGCGREKKKPKREAWQKREQVYTDKTPEEWLKLIQHHNVQARNRAIDALILYRRDGTDSVPQLIEVLETTGSGQVRLSVTRALGGMGSDARTAVPALCKALNDSNWDQRDAAAEALGAIGEDLGSTVPTLLEALSNSDERVRGSAARALGRLRTGDAGAVSALAAALEDEDPNVRAEAAEALEHIGPKAKAAIPALEKAAKAEHFIVAQAAQEALKSVRGP